MDTLHFGLELFRIRYRGIGILLAYIAIRTQIEAIQQQRAKAQFWIQPVSYNIRYAPTTDNRTLLDWQDLGITRQSLNFRKDGRNYGAVFSVETAQEIVHSIHEAWEKDGASWADPNYRLSLDADGTTYNLTAAGAQHMHKRLTGLPLIDPEFSVGSYRQTLESVLEALDPQRRLIKGDRIHCTDKFEEPFTLEVTKVNTKVTNAKLISDHTAKGKTFDISHWTLSDPIYDFVDVSCFKRMKAILKSEAYWWDHHCLPTNERIES